MKFNIGDEVICVDNWLIEEVFGFGKLYTVKIVYERTIEVLEVKDYNIHKIRFISAKKEEILLYGE